MTCPPAIFSIFPGTGNLGGTLLTITGSGFGVDDESPNMIRKQDTTWDLCLETKVLEYGKMTCLTREV